MRGTEDIVAQDDYKEFLRKKCAKKRSQNKEQQ